MSTKRIWAVGFKGWVEFRSSDKPPKLHTTEISKPIKVRESKPNPTFWADYSNGINSPIYTTKTVSKQLKIKTTVYTGGKVLGCIKSARFARLFNITVRKDGLLELTPEMITVLEKNGGLKA